MKNRLTSYGRRLRGHVRWTIGIFLPVLHPGGRMLLFNPRYPQLLFLSIFILIFAFVFVGSIKSCHPVNAPK